MINGPSHHIRTDMIDNFASNKRCNLARRKSSEDNRKDAQIANGICNDKNGMVNNRLGNMNNGLQQCCANLETKIGRRKLAHPHHCLFGMLHLANGMRLLIGIGILVLIGFCLLEALYFRRTLFVMAIPGVVVVLTVVAVEKHESRLLWPIIGISFFHLFLDAYAALIFLFFFFFKPLYIIMVLNWAFDTLHTSKTPSYYFHCATIIIVLIIFFLFNLWQLRVSLRFQTFLEELLGSGSSASSSTDTTGAISNASSNSNGSDNADNVKEQNAIAFMGNRVGHPDRSIHQQQQCKVLNQPPLILLGNSMASTGNQRRMLLCPSPASQRAGGPHQICSSALGPRRPSLGEIRHFGTR